MNTRVVPLACALIGLTVGCEDAQKPGPAELQVQSATDDVMDLLPASTLVAAAILELDSRWDELRTIPALAGLQDRALGELGLDAADVAAICGSRAVLALVSDETAGRVVPLAVLDPPSSTIALQRLATSGTLFAVEARGALWVGPTGRERLVERIAVGDGTSLRQAVDIEALAEHLPAAGLARVVINPRAVARWLRRWADYHGASPARAVAQLMAADLEAIEVAGFRRDLVNGHAQTDAWVGIDGDVVPPAVAVALSTDRGPAVLPPRLPANVLIAKSFRSEAEAGLAWLRALAARDPDGPLRQLDFWIGEFEARTGRDVERDIVAALGQRGLALVLESEKGDGLELAAVVDADDPGRLEAALIDLRDWLGEQLRSRTLGLARPRPRDEDDARGAAHAFDVWSPFGSYSGPVFEVADGRLVIATSRRALSLGLELAGSAATWVTPDWALVDGPPDEVAVIDPGVLTRLLAADLTAAGRQASWYQAILEFLAAAGEGRVRVYHQRDGFRVAADLPIGH